MLTLTVSDAFTLYLQKQVLAESSIDIKKRAVRFFIEAVGDLPVGSVNYAEAEEYKVWLAGNRSAAAANVYLGNLKPVFSWLKMRGYIELDPFATITLLEVNQRRKKVFEPWEIERILQVADLRWQVITLLGLCTLRRAETLNLTVNDLNFEGKYLRVSAKEDSPTTWQWKIKNHREAIVPLPETFTLPDMIIDLHQRLRELISKLPWGQPYICIEPEIYTRMIAMKLEGRLNYIWRGCPWQNFTRDWLNLLHRAAIKPRRYHDLRATLPTFMAHRGISMVETQRLLRHKSIQTTAQYYIAVDEKNLVTKMSEIANAFGTVT